MLRLTLQKIGQMLIVMFFVSLIIFFTFRLLPGDPAQLRLGMNPTPEAVEALREEMGLNDPLVVQYVRWLTSVLQGDFGQSALDGSPVTKLLFEALPRTAELAIIGLLLSLVIAIPIGVLATLFKNTIIDKVAQVFSLFGFSTPAYWFAVLLMLLFAYKIPVLPAGGYVSFFQSPIEHLSYLILPVLTVGIINAAQIFRFIRSGMLEVISQDYVRTAKAKGLHNYIVIGKHVARNAIPNLITVLGLNVSLLLSGMVITEQIFAWPGLGWLMIQSILSRDYEVVQGAVLISAAIVVLINLITDVINAMLDPRIKYN